VQIIVNVAVAVAFSTCFFLVPVGARFQSTDERAKSMPDGKGKALVASVCVGCHLLETALNTRATAEQWRDTVQTMIDRGALITSEEAAVIASYLGEHYGPTQAGSGRLTPPAPSGSTEQSAFPPDGPGKDLLARKCFQCHREGMWKDLRQDRRAWEGVLYRMVGRGALWTEEEINTMAEYLARAFGPVAGKRQ
jgi:cytochrome c5